MREGANPVQQQSVVGKHPDVRCLELDAVGVEALADGERCLDARVGEDDLVGEEADVLLGDAIGHIHTGPPGLACRGHAHAHVNLRLRAMLRAPVEVVEPPAVGRRGLVHDPNALIRPLRSRSLAEPGTVRGGHEASGGVVEHLRRLVLGAGGNRGHGGDGEQDGKQ